MVLWFALCLAAVGGCGWLAVVRVDGWLVVWVGCGFLVWYMMVFSGFGILVRRLCVLL